MSTTIETGLTATETAAIAVYENQIDGIPDSFDMLDDLGIESETIAGTIAQARQFLSMLADWHTALDTLYSHTAEGSPDARGYLTREANHWYHLLNLTRREACRAFAGTAGPQPEVDSGWLTFCDVPPRVKLDGTIAAESA